VLRVIAGAQVRHRNRASASFEDIACLVEVPLDVSGFARDTHLALDNVVATRTRCLTDIGSASPSKESAVAVTVISQLPLRARASRASRAWITGAVSTYASETAFRKCCSCTTGRPRGLVAFIQAVPKDQPPLRSFSLLEENLYVELHRMGWQPIRYACQRCTKARSGFGTIFVRATVANEILRS
jgi:hypothetical protein